ncbi:MAG: hypothetical protein WB688_19245, partial [Trebonia sp.]
PETGFATAKFFAAPGHASSAIRPIQVVHRNTKLIAAYTAAAYGGAVCAIMATVLLIWTIRRSRRDRRNRRPIPSFVQAPPPQSAYQAPPWTPPPSPMRNRDDPNSWFDPR